MDDPEEMVCVVSMSVDGRAWIVQVHGFMDFRHAALLREQVDAVLRGAHVPVLIVDLSTVAFCDSSGLSALVYALRRCRNASTHLILTGVRGTQERWMTITGLSRIFDRRPHVTDALPAAAG
ncbi:STAS domain-containing protein [Nonomuraea fuscirosea]|uniref:STAS domain-containing protein n=1 Tax=Nonomuraea fuscirosea TaxID=1291556 RepID=UPI0034318597